MNHMTSKTTKETPLCTNRQHEDSELRENLLDVNLWRQQLQAGVGKHPCIVDCGWAMFGQVLLAQVAGEADDPGVLALSDMGKHPNV